MHVAGIDLEILSVLLRKFVISHSQLTTHHCKLLNSRWTAKCAVVFSACRPHGLC